MIVTPIKISAQFVGEAICHLKENLIARIHCCGAITAEDILRIATGKSICIRAEMYLIVKSAVKKKLPQKNTVFYVDGRIPMVYRQPCNLKLFVFVCWAAYLYRDNTN